jgi:hypothetical protein
MSNSREIEYRLMNPANYEYSETQWQMPITQITEFNLFLYSFISSVVVLNFLSIVQQFVYPRNSLYSRHNTIRLSA